MGLLARCRGSGLGGRRRGGRSRCCGGRRRRGRCLAGGDWKVQREPAALAGRALHVHPAFVRAHHAMHHGQAQARALAHGLGGEEGLEDALQRGGIHAGAAVAHRQGHVVDGRQAKPFGEARVGLYRRSFDMDAAALSALALDGVDGIGAQVEQGLLDLGGVGQHGGQACLQLHVQLDGGGQGHAQQALGVVRHLGQRHGRALRGLVAAEGEDLAHQVARAAAGLVDLQQAFQHGRACGAVRLGEFDVAQDRAQDVVEVVRNAPGHGAHGLHLVRLAQLGFQLIAVRLGLLATGEVAREHGGGLAPAHAFCMALERHAHLHGQLLAAGGEGRHLAQQRLRGELRKRQGLGRVGQEAVERAAQRVAGSALEQRGRRGVEHGDALVLVHADDGVQRRVDDGFEPLFAGVQLFVALLQRDCAVLQRLALGQQRALVDHRAQILRQRRAAGLGRLDVRDVQVARDAAGGVDEEHHFLGFAVPQVLRLGKDLAHAGGVLRAHKGHQGGQRPVAFGGLEGAVRHRVGLHHHVVFVHHHEGQGHAGKQGLEAFVGALGHRLAVAQHLVLVFQLGLVGAQLGHQAIARGGGGPRVLFGRGGPPT